MKTIFVFDVDGTLTPSRQEMYEEFRNWFTKFQEANHVILVTGSDSAKTLEQVGNIVYNFCDRVYQCSGNEHVEQGRVVYRSEWKIPSEAEAWLREELDNSQFPLRTGQHIEDRTGMCNFSILGRGCTLSERKMYFRWDQKHEERYTIARLFMEKFPDLQADVAGETGLDIFPRGKDKAQIFKDLEEFDEVHFFGDKTNPGGNDHALAQLVYQRKGGHVYQVRDWQHTWKILKGLVSG